MTTRSATPASAAPLPCTWVMSQKWRHLLFMSWPIPVSVMRLHVPADIELDTFDGNAWLSLLPMHMDDLHFRYFPPVPGTSNFPEINLRTYVRLRGVPGVYFFSLDAASRLGALVARYAFHTPYLYARMKLTERTGSFRIESHRKASRWAPAADFVASYGPVGEAREPEPDSLGGFLVERYTAVAEFKPGVIYTGPVSHAPWRLANADVDVEVNSLISAAGLPVPEAAPSLHFSWGTLTRLCLVERWRG